MKKPIRHAFDGLSGVIAAILLASVFVNLLVLTAPLYMLQLFARVMASGSIPTLIALTTGACIALVFYFIFDALRQRIMTRLGSKLEARLGPVVLDGLMRGQMPRELEGSEPIRDIQEVRGFVISPIFTAILDAPWSLVFVVVIFLFSPVLGMVAVTGLLILAAIGVAGEIVARRPDQKAEEAAREVNRSVLEMMQNSEVIHAMGHRQALLDRWRLNAFSAIIHGTVSTDRVALLSSLAKAARMGLQIAMMGIGVLLVINNQLSPGLMIASSILLGRAAAPVEQTISGWRGVLKARAAKARLDLFLAHLHEGACKLEMPAPEGLVSVEKASVVLRGQKEPTLLDVTMTLQPGQSLGLIGPSGSGKTTLLRCLVGLQPLARGHIRIDGASLSDWDPDQIGKYIGYLPQQVRLMQGTVAENIAMLDMNADPAEIVAAAKLAQVHDLILTLPGGYNAQVGPDGSFLSAGQRQRIGLARAFFGDRKLVVLDEPNANLDPEGEEALAQSISEATERGAVVVVVTHRMNLLHRVSHAAVLQAGQLVRFGEARTILEDAIRPEAKKGDKVAPIPLSRRDRVTGPHSNSERGEAK